MTRVDVASPDLERFRRAIAAIFGLRLETATDTQLHQVLQRRAAAASLTTAAYVERLEGGTTDDDARGLAQELTVGETYFLRHREQFRAFTCDVLPDLVRRGWRQPVPILSAGCATGEEVYSIAAAALESSGTTVSVTGADVNLAGLEHARRGRYTQWAMRELTDAERQRWFRQQGSAAEIAPELRAFVRFERVNLLDAAAPIWFPDMWPVIFLRNVLMHLTADAQQRLLTLVHRALVPGGYLFLSHAETLRGSAEAFDLCHTHGAFYYRRREPVHRLRPRAAPPSPAVAPVSVSAQPQPQTQTRSGRRGRAGSPPRTRSSSLRIASVAHAVDLARPRTLLRQERYVEALAVITALPSAMRTAPDVLLLEAALLIQHGACAEAERVCHRLLAADALSGGAHYLLALCREAEDDLDAAREAHRAAAALDRSFAMPHLHLGLLARRLGEGPAARRALGEALALLPAESDDRVLLFGGGFGRDALMALCRIELAALEARHG